MNRMLIVVVIAVLALGFIGSSYAAYSGVGLVTSGTNTPNSRGVFFIFPGGGPGFGK